MCDKPLTDKNGFEIQTCPRCGGSGQYSYCQRYGRVCFKCGGAGRIYTKRGQAAVDYLRGLRTKTWGELVVGDIIRDVIGIGSKETWVRITEIKPATCYGNAETNAKARDITYVDCKNPARSAGRVAFIENAVIHHAGADDLRAKIAAALVYQSQLTKSGRPMKNPGK